jgi:hypothetical protein
MEKSFDGSNLSIKDPSNYYPGEKRSYSAIDQDTVENLKHNLKQWDVSSLKSLELSDLLDSETPTKLDNLIRNQNLKINSSELDQLIPFISGINELLRHSWALYNLKLDDSAKLSGILKALNQLIHDHRQYASINPTVSANIITVGFQFCQRSYRKISKTKYYITVINAFFLLLSLIPKELRYLTLASLDYHFL